MIALQTEFRLEIAVCAWCRPHERGTGLGTISHGICPRHLRQLKRRIWSRSARTVKSIPRRDSALEAHYGRIEPFLPL